MYLEPKITWLGHSSFRIEHKGKVVYIDPWKIEGGPKADLIVVTHSHMDHFSDDDIRKVAGDDTVIIGSQDIEPSVGRSIGLKPGDEKDLGWSKVEAYRAYNPDKQFHPKANDWLGVVIDLSGYRIYHTGDTDVIPEMNEVKDIDLALVPVGGTYTMTAAEAAECVRIVKPKKAVPMHWGDIIGGRKDAEDFAKLAKCSVVIMAPEK
ncbi:MAG: MBL fold metallo-hydrolase [Candidatus Thermoplasmatota archaeon]|nr:MBL fold metallo-hydrolase [Candidatus Thermoplasmatota archaeon]